MKTVRNSVLTAVAADPGAMPERSAAPDIPEIVEDVGPAPAPALDLPWQPIEPVASGTDVISAAVKTLPNAPGVYRMIDAKGDGALRRQGAQPEEARRQLHARSPARAAASPA